MPTHRAPVRAFRTFSIRSFRGRLPGQPPGLFETMIVEVDALSGNVVSIART
jgi:hypothetical protein